MSTLLAVADGRAAVKSHVQFVLLPRQAGMLDIAATPALDAWICVRDLAADAASSRRRRARMNKQEIRRTVIREWMALPRDKRQTEEHAAGFAAKTLQSHELPRSRRDPHRVLMGWLLPRAGRP
jgi:hypothetical protein